MQPEHDNANSPDSHQIGKWRFLPDLKQLVSSSGKTVTLEDKVSDLLLLLCEKRGEIVSKEEILDHVWGGRNLSEQTVPVAISKVRKALEETGSDKKLLQTIPKRGYRLTAETEHQNQPVTKNNSTRFWFGGIIAAAVMLIAILWPQATPFVPPADADKPGIILTVKDIRTALESEKDTGKVIALSELTSYYLSQVPEVLVIRHWWNVDAPDPTGGIFTRYGENTPVYTLTGSLIEDDGTQLITLFLSNPKTDEVIWSGVHPVATGSKAYFDTLAEMFNTIGVLGIPQKRSLPTAVPSDDDRYWTARYLAHLSSERAAASAAEALSDLIADHPADAAARSSASALMARWQDISLPVQSNSSTDTETRNDYFVFVDGAAIAFYRDKDISTAAELVEEALKTAPGDHYALSLKAEILVSQDKMEEALMTYQKAARLAPFARAYQNRLMELMPGNP